MEDNPENLVVNSEDINSKERIYHLFTTEKNYTVIANEWAGRTFYNLKLITTRYDGQINEGICRVEFIKCDAPPNNSVIRIKNAKEDWYMKDKFHLVFKIVVFNYEIIQTSAETAKEAINEFYNKDYDEDDLPF